MSYTMMGFRNIVVAFVIEVFKSKSYSTQTIIDEIEAFVLNKSNDSTCSMYLERSTHTLSDVSQGVLYSLICGCNMHTLCML